MDSLMTLRFAQPNRSGEGAAAHKLRRAGYADGERRPRRSRHWANR